MSRQTARDFDAGSAVVEFIAALLLLTMVLLSAMEVGMYIYVRNVAQAVAAETARFGAPLGRDAYSAKARIEELLPDVLGEHAKKVSVDVRERDDFVYVSIEGRFTPSTPLVPELPLRARAWAFKEESAVKRR